MMNQAEGGATIIEILGALAISSLMALGISTMVDKTLEESKGQQAAFYQTQIVSAATQYINNNYNNLLTIATATDPAKITLSDLSLPGNFPLKNTYNQQPCILLLQPTSGKLSALVVTEDGQEISDDILIKIAVNAGQGAGYISKAQPNVAQGTSWTPITAVSTPALTDYFKLNCSGTQATQGHLVTQLYFDGPTPVDPFLHSTVTGTPPQPQLNEMNTPLQIATNASISEGSTNTISPKCQDATDNGKLATNSNGALLICQAGMWKRSANTQWKASVTTAELASLTNNTQGDVRMASDTLKTYTWDGSSWKALAVDDNNNLSVPGNLITADVQITGQNVLGAACNVSGTNGAISKTASGQLLVCQSNTWVTMSGIQLGTQDVGCINILPTTKITTKPNSCVDYSGPPMISTWDATVDTYSPSFDKKISMQSKGIISVDAWSQMVLGDGSGLAGQYHLTVEIINDDTGVVIGVSDLQSNLINDGTLANGSRSYGMTTSLQATALKNTNGYTIRFTTPWTVFKNGTFIPTDASWNSPTQTVEEVPLRTGWNITTYY